MESDFRTHARSHRPRRRALKAILRYPPTRPLDAEAKELLWKFRYSLRDQPAALPKFLRTVDWGDATEAHQAAQLMEQWAPIDPAAALELLSGQFTNDEAREREGKGGTHDIAHAYSCGAKEAYVQPRLNAFTCLLAFLRYAGTRWR